MLESEDANAQDWAIPIREMPSRADTMTEIMKLARAVMESTMRRPVTKNGLQSRFSCYAFSISFFMSSVFFFSFFFFFVLVFCCVCLHETNINHIMGVFGTSPSFSRDLMKTNRKGLTTPGDAFLVYEYMLPSGPVFFSLLAIFSCRRFLVIHSFSRTVKNSKSESASLKLFNNKRQDHMSHINKLREFRPFCVLFTIGRDAKRLIPGSNPAIPL